MIHLVALVLYGSHRWCLSHVGTEGLVVWGAVVFAVVLHLTFYRWAWGGDFERVIWPVRAVQVFHDRIERHGDSGYYWVGLFASELGERHPAYSTVFGVLAPLVLVGVAGFVQLGGRKADDKQ